MWIKRLLNRHNKILYITYNGLCQPLGQSQVIPYLVGLSKHGYKCTVLSFEHHYEKDFAKEYQKVKAQLDSAGIGWISLKYHKNPKFFSSIYDIMHGTFTVFIFFLQQPFYAVHARGYVPAMVGLVLKKVLHTQLIFDMRGLMPDEKVDADQWIRSDLSYNITKRAEKRLLKNADAIIVLTDKIKTYLKAFTYINAPLTVIPTCVDNNRFPPREETKRDMTRKELGVSNKTVIVYSGSLGTWYMFEKMVEFFKTINRLNKNTFFLILNKNEHNYARQMLEKHNISVTDYALKAVNPDEVYRYLWASDIGIFFIKPGFAKQASSPTKLGEYLSCGLPIIANDGIGDVEDVLLHNEIGSILYNFSEDAYNKVFQQATELLKDRDFSKRAQKFIAEYLSVETGIRKYDHIYDAANVKKSVLRLLCLLARPIESPGSRFRIFQYLPYFDRADINCTVSSSLNKQEYMYLYNTQRTSVAKEILIFIKSTIKQILQLFKIRLYDAILINKETIIWGGPWIEKYIVQRGIPVIYDFDDAVWLPTTGIIDMPKTIKKILKSEKKFDEIIRFATHVVAGNSYLAEHAGVLNKNTCIIPTVVDTDYYMPAEKIKKHNQNIIIGWTGSMSTSPYLKLLNNVWKRLPANCELRIIGGMYEPEGIKIKNIKWQLNTELNEIGLFDIGIMPLIDDEWAKGKCGLKAIEYMAMGIPCVASPVGVNTEIIRDGFNGFLAYDEEEWVKKLSLLIENPDIRQGLGNAGRKTVEEKYSVKAWAPVYARIIKEMVDTKYF